MLVIRGSLWMMLVAVVGVAGLGCKQYYNGALGLRTSDAEMVKEYHRAREQRMIEREQQVSASGPAARVGIDGGTTGIEPAPAVQPQPQPQQPPQQPSVYPVDDATHGRPTNPGDGHVSAVAPRPEYVSTDFNDNPTTPAPPSRTAMNPMSVFGNLPGRTGPVSPLDTTGQVRRVSSTEEGADFDVTTDPTYTSLIYSSTRHRQTADIYRQRIDGSAITQLTDDPGNEVMPAVSPDGRTIAFASDRNGNWDLFLMDAEGGPAVQLTSDRTHDIHPSFSPDGRRLVYSSYGERSGQWEMVVIDVENPSTKQYIGNGLFPQWSPTGGTILFQRARERGTRWFSVWTVELDEKDEAGSPTEIAWSTSFACITPAWSPDGKAVVFCTVMNPDADTQGRPAESDVWLVRADGSGRTRLTQGRFANLQPVWSGDNAIYFVSNRGGRGVENIWALDPDDAIQVAFPRAEPSSTPTADVPTASD